MKICMRFLITTGILLFELISLWAQDELKEDSFQFTVRAFGDDYFEGIHCADVGGDTVLLEFNPYEKTGIYHLPKDTKEVVFFRLVQDVRGREMEEPVAVADLDGIESRAFIVFLSRRDPGRDLPYTVLVADESPGKFEAGYLRFLNLAGPSLMARVGDATVSLETGFGGDMKFDPTAIEEVPFQFAVRVSQEWKIIYSTGFRAHPDVGTLAILKPPARQDSLRLQVELSQGR